VTVQGLDWQRGKWGRIASRVLLWGEAAAVSSADATMVVSRTLQQHYRQRYKRETIYVPNGATLAPARNLAQLLEWDLVPDNYVLISGEIFAGEELSPADRRLRKVRTDMKLVLAGGSSHSDWYVKSLRRHESDRIRFLPGSREAIWKNFSPTPLCSCFRPNLRDCRWRCWMRWRRASAC
jgi:hypothetical protein